MSAASIRCENDLKLAETLLATREVKKVNDWIEEHQEERPSSIRRHLLSTSVRLSPQMSPKLHAMAKHCGEKLGLDLPLEIYAYSDARFNAACFKPEDGRLYIMFSSALLEAFQENELLYVMGHEIGHYIYHHHDIPVGYILKGKSKPPADLALKLFAWSRYAEFSADRAGAYCTNDMEAVGRALFKLAAGVSDLSNIDAQGLVQFDLDEFIQQADDMVSQDAEPGQGAPMQDWFSTHPFSPLRVKALVHFHQSELMQPNGFSKDELELRVTDLMKLMEPGYLEGKTRDTKIMRNLFIAAAIQLAELGDGISDNEREILEKFLGKDFALDKLSPEKLAELLPQRIEEATEHTSKSQRMQLLRDLVLVAQADTGHCQQKENALTRYAKALQIDENFIFQCLGQDRELD